MKTTLLILAIALGTSSVLMAQNKPKLTIPKAPDLTKKVTDKRVKLPEIAKLPRFTGRIIETSFPDRLIRIRMSSGERLFVTIPANVTIAGANVNVHNDGAAFRRVFKLDEYVIAFENSRLAADKIEARDIAAGDSFWSRVGQQ
ncbi:MAG: hypothetical protein P1U86_17725 [Verrucomicrobiales bacterium]|nr:hypothetical protein [Verrucomicrobiales bacterium]